MVHARTVAADDPLVDATAQQETATITGIVVDVNGNPVIGATVITDDGRGVLTDTEGRFEIPAAVGSNLTVSYIGYNTQTVTAGPGRMTITLEEGILLGEVQVVAYGAQKKVTVVGAISGIKGEELTRTPTSSISNLLGGALSGITTIQYSGEPGADAADIFVRGKATWDSDNAKPLIQVDGVERDLDSIDPNEIESITVLKDASATAVFGVRGANGVVLITTKRGQTGKAKISLTTSASIVTPTKLVELANSYQYATFHNMMRENDGAAPLFTDDILQKFQDHSDPIRFPDTNWMDYVMKDATLQSQHNINISGGTERVRYFISAGALTQGGLFKQFHIPYDMTYQYRRFNYRSNLDIDATKTTLVSVNIAGNVDNANRPYTGQSSTGIMRDIYWSTPFSSPGFVGDKLVLAAEDYPDLRLPFVGGNGLGYLSRGYMETSNNNLTTDLIVTQNLDFITKGLSVRVKGSYNSTFYVYKDALAELATYTPVLKDDGSIGFKQYGQETQPAYTERRGKARDWYMEAGFDYARSFGDHTVSGLVLYNQSKVYYPSEYQEIPRGLVGLVGRVTYDWKNRYMLDFNVGYNGSENFAPGNRFGLFPAGGIGWAISEERFWEPLKPVIGFMKFRVTLGLVGNDAIGGSRFMYTSDPYAVNSDGTFSRWGQNLGGLGYIFGSNRNISNGAYELSRNNPDVTWEKAFKQNYGVDFSMVRERFRGNFEYFKEKRTNILLVDGTAPYIIGFLSPYANLGQVNSWGWELSVRWDDRIGKEFRYWVGANLSYNQNEIIERKESPKNYDYLYQKGNRIGSRSNLQFWKYYYVGIEDDYKKTFGTDFPNHGITLQPGDAVYVDKNGDGVINSEDAGYGIGYTDDPQYMLGVNLGFNWKRFDVSMQWTGAWKVSRQISDVFMQPFFSNSSQSQGGLLAYHLNNTWTEDNPSQSAKYPRASWAAASNNYLTGVSAYSSTLYEKNSSYLRLKTIEVAYSFDLPFMEKMKLSTFQLALSGYNLLTFTNYIWGDPESRATNSPTYPLQKTYSLTLRLGF
ncbi:MAG: TonB-dependent receptor [Alistipes sp.]|nr:TonB-dependent receptor [Alistipes sp.]